MFKKNPLVYTLLLAAALLLLTACSAKEKVRWDGEINLGELPSDMLYVDGIPQVITVSSESDGDLILSYLNNNGKLVAQMYGCPAITLTCGKLEKLGSYYWNFSQ